MSQHLCVIPARGGSKGLPRKNVLEVAGVPTIAYTIRAARESGLFGDHVYVASDDDEIIEISREYGARVPYREPDEMAGDTVSSTVPVIWLYEKLVDERQLDFDWIWNLQPTSPLRTPGDIREAADSLEAQPEADFLASTTPIDPHYFHWALRESKEVQGFYELWFPDFLVERPKLPPVHRPNGAIKVGRPEPLVDNGSVFGPNLTTSTIPEHRSIHIRSEFDRKKTEFILEEYPEEFEWMQP